MRSCRNRVGAAAAVVAMAVVAACSPADGPAAGTPSELVTGAQVTRIAVIGDFGSGKQGEAEIASAIRDDDARSRFAALITTGDNVYPSGNPEDFAAAWTVPYGWVDDAGIPVLASLGNHDRKSGKLEQVADLLGMPARWYSEQVGDVQVIVLDANDVENPDQQRFLDDVLARPRGAGVDWRVVVFHQPAFSCSRHQSTPAVQKAWVSLFSRSDVDLVLNGHDHVYERFGPIDGVTYVVTGAAGDSLYEMRGCPKGTPDPVVAAARRHYVVLEASPDQLRIEGVTEQGTLLDSAVLPHRDARRS